MAQAVKAGQRVVLVTCTRGEMGEIVVPDMDTPDNHRRLGEIRAGELERAMGALGVTEWENLGYRDSDMMGRAGNHDARCLLAGGHRRGHRPARVPRPHVPARRHDDLQRVRRLRPPGPHPDPPRRGRRVRAGRRPGVVPGAARARARRDGRRRPTRAGSRRGRRPSSTSRRSRPRSGRRWPSGWRRSASAPGGRRPRTPRPSSWPSSRPTSPGCSSPTSRSRPGSTSSDVLDAALGADQGSTSPRSATTTRSCASARTRGPSSGTARRSSGASRGSRRPTRRPTCSRGSRAASPGPTGWGAGAEQPAAVGAS